MVIYDCPFMDDENINAINNTDIIEQFKQTHFKCQTTNKYILQFKFKMIIVIADIMRWMV